MMHSTIEQFLPAIQKLPIDRPLTKQDLLIEKLLLQKSGKMEMYYAPHNKYVNQEAKVIIIGITPGWGQMKTAYEQFTQSLTSGKRLETCLIETKKAAGFAGSMRTNLTRMLDQCELPQVLDIPDSSNLFNESRHLLHTTSVIKYPVFLNGKNYNGHQPTINRSSLLKDYAYKLFPKELARIAPPALIIPLGKTVEQIVLKLATEQKLSGHTYLTGFPHPSGANGHRVKQFQMQNHNFVKRWKHG